MGTSAIEAFTHHGVRGAMLVEVAAKNYTLAADRNKIQVYDIGDDLCFGAVYPDSARIAVPRHWFPEAQRIEVDLKANGQLFAPSIDGQRRTTDPEPTLQRVRIKKKHKIKIRRLA